jgi:hypothetical protein
VRIPIMHRNVKRFKGRLLGTPKLYVPEVLQQTGSMISDVLTRAQTARFSRSNNVVFSPTDRGSNGSVNGFG